MNQRSAPWNPNLTVHSSQIFGQLAEFREFRPGGARQRANKILQMMFTIFAGTM